jgi:mono/diheme cytochrome c family protein
MYRALSVVGLGIALSCGAYAATTHAQEIGQKTAPVSLHGYDGQDQFGTYCASCHGRSAKGDGVVGAVLRKKPPDLTTIALRNGGTYDEELVYRIIDGSKPVEGHGGSDMPVWGDAFSKSSEGSSPSAVKDRIDAIVKWLGRVQQKAPSQ